MAYSSKSGALTPEERAERERARAEREARIRDKNNRLGVTVFQWSWIMVFVCLIVVNLQLRWSPEWMAEGVQPPDRVLPTWATVLLVLSSVLGHSALNAVKTDRVAAFLARWRGAIGLGLIFFVTMLQQFFAVELADGQFAAVYRLMIGYHALHALAIGYMMVQVYRYGVAQRYHARNNWAVEATVRLWDFVTVAWLMFYVVLYLV